MDGCMSVWHAHTHAHPQLHKKIKSYGHIYVSSVLIHFHAIVIYDVCMYEWDVDVGVLVSPPHMVFYDIPGFIFHISIVVE